MGCNPVVIGGNHPDAMPMTFFFSKPTYEWECRLAWGRGSNQDLTTDDSRSNGLPIPPCINVLANTRGTFFIRL